MPFSPTFNTSDLAHRGLLHLLSDADHGFNPRLQSALSLSGVSVPSSFRLPLNFAETSLNVFPVDLEPAELAKAKYPHTLPLMTVYAGSLQDQKREKFYTFAGPVTIGVNIFIRHTGTRVPWEMAKLVDAFQNALIYTINDTAYGTWSIEYDPRLVYNGDLQVDRSQMVPDADGWMQAIKCGLTFEVHSK